MDSRPGLTEPSVRHWTDQAAGHHLLETELFLPLAREKVFPFFADARNLESITPPELRFRITSPLPVEMKAGALIDYRLRLMGVPFDWRTEITVWEPSVRFIDMQIKGPYRSWVHLHHFRDVPGGTVMTDQVRYTLPMGVFGVGTLPFVRRQLTRIFRYRWETVLELLRGVA